MGGTDAAATAAGAKNLPACVVKKVVHASITKI
jgi:hypothetical protein